MKIGFYTLGCKVNQYETQEMIELFEGANHSITTNVADADVIVVNSCTVTSESVRKMRQAIRRFKKQQPDLQYESLAFVRYVIETYGGYGNV